MAIKRKSKPPPEIPLTSTSDVAFLLLIFFLVAASNTADRGTPLDLPRTEKTTETKQTSKNLELGVKQDMITVGDQSLTSPNRVAELEVLLRTQLAGKTDPSMRVVLINNERNVPYQMWSDVVGAVEAAGGIPAPQMEETEAGGAAPAAAGAAGGGQ